MYASVHHPLPLHVRFTNLRHCSSIELLLDRQRHYPSSISLQRPPLDTIMSDLEFRSYLEGMKMKFWHQRQHLQNDEIQRQWAASTAAYTSILLDTEAPTRPPALTPNQGQQTAHQSVSKSWGEAAAKRPASVRIHSYIDLPASKKLTLL